MSNDGYMNKKNETHFLTIFTLYSSEAIALESSSPPFIQLFVTQKDFSEYVSLSLVQRRLSIAVNL